MDPPKLGFCQNLGFRDGYHPEFGFPVYWLYIGDQDVIHVGKAKYSEHQIAYLSTPDDSKPVDNSAGALGSARIDHVCFNCEKIEEFLEFLESALSRKANGEWGPDTPLFLECKQTFDEFGYQT